MQLSIVDPVLKIVSHYGKNVVYPTQLARWGVKGLQSANSKFSSLHYDQFSPPTTRFWPTQAQAEHPWKKKQNSAPTWGVVGRSQKWWSQLHKLIYVSCEEAADLLYFGNKQLKILATVTWFAAKAQKVCCELTAVRVEVNSKTTVQIKILSSENVCLFFSLWLFPRFNLLFLFPSHTRPQM